MLVTRYKYNGTERMVSMDGMVHYVDKYLFLQCLQSITVDLQSYSTAVLMYNTQN